MIRTYLQIKLSNKTQKAMAEYKIENVIRHIPSGRLYMIIEICSPSIWVLRKWSNVGSLVPYYWTIPYEGDLNNDKDYELVK